jgi:hypothetical protein
MPINFYLLFIYNNMFTNLDDYYDIISYFRLDLPVNEKNFNYLLKKFINKKNNLLITKLLLILNQDEFLQYKNYLLQYFSFYKNIPIIKQIFDTNLKLYQYRFISILLDKNIEIFSLLLDIFDIKQLRFYTCIDKDYDNNYIKLINDINNDQHAEVLIKIIEKNYKIILDLNFDILNLISKKDILGNTFYEILNIYKLFNINDIKSPSILLINCLEKKLIFNYQPHNRNILFFHENFNKNKLNINILNKNHKKLFYIYIKIISF